MASITTINVGGVDRSIEDSTARSIITSEVARLDNRIDQAIVPSGGAPSAAEVTDARIGTDGTTYNTLGKAIRTQITKSIKSSNLGVFLEGQNPQIHNLDELFDSNVYAYGGSGLENNAIIGYPKKFHKGFTLIVVSYYQDSTGGTTQIAVDLMSGEIASRAHNGVKWSDWTYEKSAYDSVYDNNVFPSYFNYDSLLNAVLDFNTGNLISNQYTTGYSVTDYIPAKYGEIVSIAYSSGADLCVGCLYDSNKRFLRPVWVGDTLVAPNGEYRTWNKEWSFIVSDKNAAYFRYNVVRKDVYRQEKQFVNIINNNFRLNMVKLLKDEKTYYVGSGLHGHNNFQTIREASEYIKDNNIFGATVYVNAGVYDLTVELADKIGPSYDGNRYNHGILLGYNTHWIFSDGSYLKFNYDGSNVDVANLYSPLVICGSCTLENLNIEVRNCQYCVHDDWYVRDSNWIVKYINCVMKHNGNTVGSYDAPICIGGGLLPNEIVQIEGGKYTCQPAFNYPISYHSLYQSSSTIYPSRLIFKDIWMSGGIRLQDAPYNSNHVETIITNCSMGTEYGGTHTFFDIIDWNNIIRQ